MSKIADHQSGSPRAVRPKKNEGWEGGRAGEEKKEQIIRLGRVGERGRGAADFSSLARAYIMRGAAKSGVGRTFNQSPGIAVVTGLVWADRPPGVCYNGHSSRGFIRSDRKHRRVATRRGVASGLRGFHGWQRIGIRRRCERAREREILRGKGGESERNKDERRRGERLRDEDMHINRETSTEMSDHRE